MRLSICIFKASINDHIHEHLGREPKVAAQVWPSQALVLGQPLQQIWALGVVPGPKMQNVFSDLPSWLNSETL